MFYFLGIVADEDYQKGIILPSYILCQSHGTSENRSGWRVIKQNADNPLTGMNKALVKTPVGHQPMIDFLTDYRTRDHMHGSKKYSHEETKKYYPKGAMFWFACNEYGEPGNHAVFITTVPAKKSGPDEGFQRLRQAQQKVPEPKEVLSGEPYQTENTHSTYKPHLPQRRRK